MKIHVWMLMPEFVVHNIPLSLCTSWKGLNSSELIFWFFSNTDLAWTMPFQLQNLPSRSIPEFQSCDQDLWQRMMVEVPILRCFCHLVLALGFAAVILCIDLEGSQMGPSLVSTPMDLLSIFQQIPENSFQAPAKAITGVIIPYIRYCLVSPTESTSGISVVPGSFNKQ